MTEGRDHHSQPEPKASQKRRRTEKATSGNTHGAPAQSAAPSAPAPRGRPPRPPARGSARSLTKPSETSSDEWVAVGVIVGAFGIQGDVKVQPLTDFPERFERTSTLYLGPAHTAHAVESARQHGRVVVLHLAGVTTASAAQKLRGTRLYVPTAEIIPLPADQYYLHDLIGLRVEHVDGTPLGVILDVIATGGNDLFVVRQVPSGTEVLLPSVKEFVKSVDLAAGVVHVLPIPGLFDDQAEIADQSGALHQDAERHGHAEDSSAE